MEIIQSNKIAKRYWELKLKTVVKPLGKCKEVHPGMYIYEDIPFIKNFHVFPLAVKNLRISDLLITEKLKKTKVYQEFLQAYSLIDIVRDEKILTYIHCAMPMILLIDEGRGYEGWIRQEACGLCFVPAPYFFEGCKDAIRNTDMTIGPNPATEIVERIPRRD